MFNQWIVKMLNEWIVWMKLWMMHNFFKVFIKMDEDQWMYDSSMYGEFDMNFDDEQQCGMNEGHVDCSDAFNTSQVTIV